MSKQATYDKVKILGVDVDVLSTKAAITYLCQRAADQTRPACYIVKPYVEFLTAAHKQPKLATLLNDAELSIADGIALIWAAHFLYAGPRTLRRFWLTLSQIIFAPAELNWPIPDRAAGTNFTWPLLESAAANKLRIFLIGKTSPSAIDHVATTITRRLPNIIIAGTTAGHDPKSTYGKVSPEWLAQTTASIKEAKPDLILVGMGFPLQEQVCTHLAASVLHGVFIGEGGTFDYESFGGTRRKAPARIQHLGLEWLWRLIGEPKRLRRQIAIPRFIYLVWKSRR